MRAYRVVVDSYPTGSDQPGWQPATGEPYITRSDDATEFSWPRRRNYFSQSAAYNRMYLFQGYGATVHVETSEPITWLEEA